MKELRDIIKAFELLAAKGDAAVLASVIHTSGSTYRRAGARALILSDDSIVSLVSGGCLESDLVEQATEVRHSGVSKIVRYDHTENDDVVWGLGLGCAGVVDVLLERVDKQNPGPLKLIADVLATRKAGVMATVVASAKSSESLGQRWFSHQGTMMSSDGWSYAASTNEKILQIATEKGAGLIHEDGVDILVETIQPLHRLLVFGGGADAVPLVSIAAELGWYLEVFDKRRSYANTERFPRADNIVQCPANRVAEHVETDEYTVAIVMTHNYLQDLDLLKFLLPTAVNYIGVLGPKRRLQLLLDDLQKDGLQVADSDKQRLHGPAGLDIGADSAEEIALSIVSEIQAVFNHRNGGFLREKDTSIHAPTN